MRRTSLCRAAPVAVALVFASAVSGCGSGDSEADGFVISAADRVPNPEADGAATDLGLVSDVKNASAAAFFYATEHPDATTFGSSPEEVAENVAAAFFITTPGNEVDLAGVPGRYCVRARSDQGSDPDGYFFYDVRPTRQVLHDGPTVQAPERASDACDGPFVRLR